LNDDRRRASRTSRNTAPPFSTGTTTEKKGSVEDAFCVGAGSVVTSRISSSLALDTGATTANQPDFERHSNPSFFPTITGIV